MENHFSRLIEKSEQYIKTTGELYKLKAIDKSAEVISSLTANLLIIISASIFIVTFNIGIAIYVGQSIGEMYLGFLIVSAFYIIATLFIYITKAKLIERPMKDAIVQQFLNKNEHSKN